MSHSPTPFPALVLAAGLSSRMGAFKPLLALGEEGMPLVGHVIDALAGSGCVGPIIVVSGHRRAELEAALPASVMRVFNPDFAQGEMLSSVKAGLRILEKLPGPGAGGFLLAFADQPAVLSTTVRALWERFVTARPLLAQPSFRGGKGHPIVISTALAGEIEALGAHDTLRAVTARHAARTLLVAVDDPAVVEDLDTPEDFARAKARLSGTSAEKNTR